MPSVLVTGATGFIGSSIARTCAAAGWSVRSFGRRALPAEALPGYMRGDVQEPSSLKAALHGIDCVIHAAALVHQFGAAGEDAEAFEAINVRGTMNVVRGAIAAGAGHLVLVSSVAVYGPSEQPRGEDAPCRPAGPYAESKLAAERAAIKLAGDARLALTILRPATVYGEGDRGNVERLIGLIDASQFVWIGDGSNRKSLIHRDDVAQACLLALERAPATPATFNVAAPACSMREIVDLISARLKKRLWPVRVPAGLALGMAGLGARLSFGRGPLARARGTLRKWLADDVYVTAHAEQELGFRATVTLEEGIAREVDWYLAEKAKREPQMQRDAVQSPPAASDHEI